jgi:signal transduction histidine kinase
MRKDTSLQSQLMADIARLRSQVIELQLQLHEVEEQRRVETETRRDLMTALARSTGIEQTLQILLVNLRNLVNYDLVGLFLVTQEAQPSAAPGNGELLKTFPNDHPLVAALKESPNPILIGNIQGDARFGNWDEMQPIKSWMGVPILVDGEMTGFLSLGSLRENAYQKADAVFVTSYTQQLSDALKESQEPHTEDRASEELQVISQLSHALGQAESKEDTFLAILAQINALFGPVEGSFLFPDNDNTMLTLRFSMDKASLGLSHPPGEDPFWRVLRSGEMESISNIPEFMRRHPAAIYRTLLRRKKFALVIPLKFINATFGILLLAFPCDQDFTSEDYRMLAAITQITSAMLRRLFILEALELQLSVERGRLIEQAEQTAVMEERQRLARELHDSVTQLIYSQVLYAGAGLKVLNSGDTQLSQQYLSRIHQVARQALKEMRLLVYELRPEDFLEDGLVRALQRRLDSVERRSELNAQLVVDGPIELDEAAEIALYYIAMEALNNILKHSGATAVTITMRSTTNRVTVEIVDNGCGFDLDYARNSGGLGLATMRERAAALGGDLRVETHPGGGTRILASIEVPE